MKTIRRLIIVGLSFVSLTVYGQQTCQSIFVTPRIGQLSFRKDSETDLALESIRNSQRQAWYASSAAYRGEPYDQSKVVQARIGAQTILQKYFKNDPEFVGVSDQMIKNVVEKTLTWVITNENKNTSDRAALEIGRNYLLLQKLGLTEKPGKWESTFREAGFNYVTHGTSINHLVQILQQMALSPRPTDKHSNKGGDAKYVYVELPNARIQRLRPTISANATDGYYKYSMKDLLGPDGAYILISPSVVDNTKWSHVNAFWEYGAYDKKFSFKTPIEITSLLSFLRENYTRDEVRYFRELFLPEWLFTEAIDLRKNDFRVLVHPTVKDSLKAQLKELGIEQWVIDRIE